MRLTERQLNRASLGRQLLLGRKELGVVEAMHRVVALQAQEPASPYIALWNRLAHFDPAELDRAFAEQAVVKAQLMRITLHAVDARDYPAFHQAMQMTLRAARLDDRRFTRTGLSSADAEALMPKMLKFASRPRTNAEAEAWLDERLGVTEKPGVWWALRQYGPIWHHPIGGAWSFGTRPSYMAARQKGKTKDPATSMQWLARRYLEGFGPATVQDLAQFSTIYRPPAKEALTALGDQLVRLEGPNGVELFDVRGGLLTDEDTPAPPRLMAMWDSLLLAYVDRNRVIPPDYRKLVMRNNGDVLPTVLIDGYVAGVWRPSQGGIEITAFHKLAKGDWTGLEAEARAMVAFLADRDPAVYRRYAHWWMTLPNGEVRVLGA
jgi:hypothetical protein